MSIDDQPVMLDILDTAGQEEYAALRDQYMMTGEGFLLAFSLIDRTTFEELKALQLQILKVKGSTQVPIVLVGNKLDLATRDPSKRAVAQADAEKVAQEWGVRYFETSAKDGTNVDEAWRTLVRLVRKASAERKTAARNSVGYASSSSAAAANASSSGKAKSSDSSSSCKCVIC